MRDMPSIWWLQGVDFGSLCKKTLVFSSPRFRMLRELATKPLPKLLGILLLALMSLARRAETAQKRYIKQGRLSRAVITQTAGELHIKVLFMETATQNELPATAGNHM